MGSVFESICKHQADKSISGGYPTSSMIIRSMTGLSRSRVLDELRHLRSENLIELVKISRTTNYLEVKKIVGYVLTDKGKSTIIYQNYTKGVS